MKSNTPTSPFKEGQKVVIKDVKYASAVGYLGTTQTVCAHTKRMSDGEVAHLCVSRNGHYAWFRESEMRIISK